MKYIYELSNKIRKVAKDDKAFKSIMHIITEEICNNICEQNPNPKPKQKPKEEPKFSTVEEGFKSPPNIKIEQPETIYPFIYTGNTEENITVMNNISGQIYKRIDELPEILLPIKEIDNKLINSFRHDDIKAYVKVSDETINIKLIHLPKNLILASLTENLEELEELEDIEYSKQKAFEKGGM